LNESYRTSHMTKGPDYEERFSTYSFRRMSWRWERKVLNQIVGLVNKEERRGDYLDFACGTGRILAHLEERFDAAVGIDISPKMLDVATKRLRKARLILGDFNETHLLAGERFDFVTAFRFFANAEPALRRQAIEKIYGLTRSKGFFVFNNHRNCTSLTFRLLRLKARVQGRAPTSCLDAEEVLSLCRDRGFQLVKHYQWGVIPGHENWTLFPAWVQYPIESVIASARILRSLATYEIFVCQKA
jgi:SAM-dependent methyltransferase